MASPASIAVLLICARVPQASGPDAPLHGRLIWSSTASVLPAVGAAAPHRSTAMMRCLVKPHAPQTEAPTATVRAMARRICANWSARVI